MRIPSFFVSGSAPVGVRGKQLQRPRPLLPPSVPVGCLPVIFKPYPRRNMSFPHNHPTASSPLPFQSLSFSPVSRIRYHGIASRHTYAPCSGSGESHVAAQRCGRGSGGKAEQALPGGQEMKALPGRARHCTARHGTASLMTPNPRQEILITGGVGWGG